MSSTHVRSEEREVIVREGGLRVIEVGKQGPSGPHGPAAAWIKQVFEIQANGEREFALTNPPVSDSVFPSLNGLLQAGFTVTGQTLTLDVDVETIVGDMLTVHYQIEE